MGWQIVGHDWAVELLRSSLAARRLSHAYLFSGPPHIGKTALALALARALNCEEPDRPCGHCASCRKISHNVHPDVRLIVGEGPGESIKIDQIRALQREAVLAPYEGRYRVVILRQMDQASIEAANSLLKILEEPPAHVVLGLTASNTAALPATVVSRCQRLHLRPTSTKVVEAALLDRGVPQARAALLARLSGGRIGWAFSASEEELVLRRRRQDLDHLVGLLAAGRVERLELARKDSQNPTAARQRLGLWVQWWRDLFLLCGRGKGGVEGVFNTDRLEELLYFAGHVTISEAMAGLRALQAAMAHLEANVNTRLALEGLFLLLPYWSPPPQRETCEVRPIH